MACKRRKRHSKTERREVPSRPSELSAQVLANPCVDLASTAFDYDSMIQYCDGPTLTMKT